MLLLYLTCAHVNSHRGETIFYKGVGVGVCFLAKALTIIRRLDITSYILILFSGDSMCALLALSKTDLLMSDAQLLCGLILSSFYT